MNSNIANLLSAQKRFQAKCCSRKPKEIPDQHRRKSSSDRQPFPYLETKQIVILGLYC